MNELCTMRVCVCLLYPDDNAQTDRERRGGAAGTDYTDHYNSTILLTPRETMIIVWMRHALGRITDRRRTIYETKSALCITVQVQFTYSTHFI